MSEVQVTVTALLDRASHTVILCREFSTNPGKGQWTDERGNVVDPYELTSELIAIGSRKYTVQI